MSRKSPFRFIPLSLCLASSLAAAQMSPGTVTGSATTGTTTVSGTVATGTTTGAVAPATATTPATNPGGKLATEFSTLAGSQENAAALVQGLRTGTPITLTQPGMAPGTVQGTTFTAPTRPMGYGNVRIALSLARTQLANQGILNPTPEQLQGALVGSPATAGAPGGSTGILQMRASGMGWGRIAQNMGVKLGAVMSGRQPMPTAPVDGTATGTSSRVTTAAGGVGHGSSATTAAGGKHSGVSTAAGGRQSGITTAAGGGGQGHAITTGLGHGGGAASGVVTAAGGNGHGGGGGGLAKGHGKP